MILLEIAKQKFLTTRKQIISFVADESANVFLNDIETYPHAFVLACIMDRQIQAERAWLIPYTVCKHFNAFTIDALANIELDKYRVLFKEKGLHRFNDTMADVFFKGVHHIRKEYNGDAANIWKNSPSSARVVYRFLEFPGVGIKISTMAANILARQFRIPFSDYYSIDISPDVHIIRVIRRTGLVTSDATNEMIVYKAREIYPTFPGIIDFSCWEIGRNWCRPQNPDCLNCPIEKECEKKF